MLVRAMTIVKICGITNLADAQCAVDAGADMLGFILYSRSPRYIEPESVTLISTAIHQSYPAVKLVGVFVNATPQTISTVLASAGLDFAQLSGDEQSADITSIAAWSYKATRSSA